MYYLQTRYYDPENVRFLNADIYVSTGRGLLDSNMFAYCWNNPVIRSDEAGTDPFTQATADDSTPWDDHENFGRLPSGSSGGWGGTWQATMRTLRSAADGFKMASGHRDLSHSENHHLLSDKNKEYSPSFQAILAEYGFRLQDSFNIVELTGHRGRHTDMYHQLMLFAINMLDGVANGNHEIFRNGLEDLGEYIQQNWWVPYIK